MTCLPWILSLALCFGQQEPEEPVPDPVFVGDGWSADLDPARSLLILRGADGAVIAHVPLGAELRPAWPPRRFVARTEPVVVEPVGIPGPTPGSEPRWVLGAALLHLLPAGDPAAAAQAAEAVRAEGDPPEGPLDAEPAEDTPDDGRRISAVVRSGPHGPLVMFSIPRALLGTLASVPQAVVRDGRPFLGCTPSGAALRVAGEPVQGFTLAAPASITIAPGDEAGLRLAGSAALDDESPDGARARVRLLAGADVLFDSGALERGGAPRAFDVALPPGPVILEAAAESGAPVLDVIDAALRGAGGRTEPLAQHARAGFPGVDLFVDADGAGITAVGAALPMAGGVRLLDAGRDTALTPPPLLLSMPLADGVLGLLLARLPDATRMALEAGRMAVDLPTTRLGYDQELDADVSLVVAVVPAPDLVALHQRCRESLEALGVVSHSRGLAGLTRPEWWSWPLIRAVPPAGTGAFARFDTWSVNVLARQLEELGLTRFTLAIDGPWYQEHGTPSPSDDFEDLRGLIAEQHLKGRRVLLSWNLLAGEPGSFAERAGVARGGMIDPGARRLETYLQNVAHRCLADKQDGLGADGLLIEGLHRLPDPLFSSVADAAGGLGVRRLAPALTTLLRCVESVREDGLVLVRAGPPQLAPRRGGVLLQADRLEEAGRWPRTAGLALLLADVPLYIDAGSDLDLLVRAAAMGVPAISSRALMAVGAEDRAALASILRLAGERPMGLPAVFADGSFGMEIGERVLSQALDGGLLVQGSRGEVRLAFLRDGDVTLPFVPLKVDHPEDAQVALQGGAAVLKARRGVVYRMQR